MESKSFPLQVVSINEQVSSSSYIRESFIKKTIKKIPIISSLSKKVKQMIKS